MRWFFKRMMKINGRKQVRFLCNVLGKVHRKFCSVLIPWLVKFPFLLPVNYYMFHHYLLSNEPTKCGNHDTSSTWPCLQVCLELGSSIIRNSSIIAICSRPSFSWQLNPIHHVPSVHANTIQLGTL